MDEGVHKEQLSVMILILCFVPWIQKNGRTFCKSVSTVTLYLGSVSQ